MRYYTKWISNTQLVLTLFLVGIQQVHANTHRIAINNSTDKNIAISYIIPNGKITPALEHLSPMSTNRLTVITTDRMPIRAVLKLWEYDIDIAFFNNQVRILNCDYSPFSCSYTTSGDSTTVRITPNT